MSARSREARVFARELSDLAKVRVEITYERPGEWLVQWGDGPTRDRMFETIRELKASGRYPQMASQRISVSRFTGGRAWAALAIAADREGTLRAKVAASVAYRRANGIGASVAHYGTLTDADHAVLAIIEDTLEVTDYPDRPAAPEDVPAIERLVAASNDNIYRMAAILLASDGDMAGELPEGVTPLHGRKRA